MTIAEPMGEIQVDAAQHVPAPRRRRRGPVRTAKVWVIRTHRWTSMVLGLLLVLITTTGAIVLYTPEWTRWTNGAVYDTVSTTGTMPPERAMAAVAAAHPDFDPGSVVVEHGVAKVYSTDSAAHPGFWGVDVVTGRVTGFADTSNGFMALMNQIHECFFTCEDYPAYLPFLTDPVPTLGMAWLTDVTWSGLLLGVAALLLLFLGVSGLWMWWPGIKRMSHGFRVRWRKGRYARDYDLHQLVGLAAIPFLLMWGVTGANFEFGWVSTAWYAATGGETPPDTSFASTEVTSKPAPTDIGLTAAAAAAQTRAGSAAPLVYASLPAADDQTAYYDFWFARGFDPYQYGSSPGEYEVVVDRHDATHLQVNDYGNAPTLSNQLLDNWGAPMLHYGQSVNGWWRIAWFLFGLTPLLLAVTGMSTWLAKRAVRKRRREAQAARAQRDRRADPDLISR